jgi:WASH complex subunit 7
MFILRRSLSFHLAASSHSLPHPQVFTTLGELFTTLVTFDLIIQQNEVLKSSWSKYKYMISMVRNDPSAFQTSEGDMAAYEKMLVSIDFNLMSGQIFKGCIEQNYEINVDPNSDEEIMIRVRDNETFIGEMLVCIKLILDTALNNIGKPIELKEREEVIGGYALYALYRQLVPARIPPDAKMQKYLWSSQKVVPMVIVGDKTVWYPAEFLQTYCPYELKKPDPPVPAAFRKSSLQQFDATFSSKVSVLIAQINSWFVLAESRLQPSLRYEENVRKAIDLRGSIILKGLNLAYRASYLAKYALVMHAELQMPMTKSILLDIASLIEILKGIEYTFLRKQAEIAEAKEHMLTQLASACVELLKPIRTKLESSRRLDSTRLDMLTSLLILQTALSTSESFSFCRQVIVEITTAMITHSAHLSETESSKLKAYVKRLCYLANLQTNLFEACNTQFLYHHRETLFPIAITALYQHPVTLNVNRLQYLLTAYADGVKICGKIAHDRAEVFVERYQSYITDMIRDEIVKPLCRDIETDLRLHIHTKHLSHMQSTNPKDNNERPLKPFLSLAPLHILGVVINIHGEVCHYLDRTFYNLTTVALHDWRTYSDMRSLAREKYGVELLDNYLPMGSLDQGLDVLQIMRNIHVFVGR